ncbi:MAG: rhomboid family intramembrane serine protease [Myxococcota bacterium]
MAGSLTKRGRGAMTRVQSTAATVGVGVGVLWAVYAVNVVLGQALFAFAIHSWTAQGLVGLLFSPFLHASLGHLVMNTSSFALLGSLVHLRRPATFTTVSVLGALGSGLGAWLFSAPGTTTVGLSGVLFAYLGFLMTRGLFERRAVDLALSVGVTALFGSMAWGVLPLTAGVSWQAHLFGFLTGIGVAARLGRR